MDIFARIAAALALLASGAASRDNPDYDAHLKAIDDHLAGTDAHEAADNAAQNVRLDAIDRGLNQIADALTPAASGGGVPPVAGDTTGGAVPAPPITPPASDAGGDVPPAATDLPAAGGDGGIPATASTPPAAASDTSGATRAPEGEPSV